MTINAGDVKILKSQVLLDTDDGGGLMTSTEVVDGVENNLFADISELDRTYGRVSLRKCYPAVLTDTVESYYGATVIVSKKPADPRVSVCLFTTKDWSDRRSAARNRMEQYLAPGVRWSGHLLETQLEGSRAIQILMKSGDPTPEVGRTLMLVENEGKATQYYQYVRVGKVSSVEREFTTSSNVKWTGVVVTLSLTDTLRYSFHGIPPTPYESEMTNASAICRDTIVADASKYYSISDLKVPASSGSLQVKVDSIWGQLVPSAQSEIPLSDLDIAGQSSPLISSGATNCTLVINWTITSSTKVFLGSSCYPGTFSMTHANGTVTDDLGSLKQGSTVVGAIDYAGGVLTFNTTLDGGKVITFRPAAVPSVPMKSAALEVVSNNRGYVWTVSLLPIPAPRSLVVSYRSQGKWYDLRDSGTSNGVGVLKGADAAIGTGSVNYTSGAVVLSLGALPDADSKIIFSWGAKTTVFDRHSVAVAAPFVKISIPPTLVEQVNEYVQKLKGPIPGSITLSWPNPSGTGTLSITDNGHGAFNGPEGVGKILYAQGDITFTPSKLLLAGTTISVTYSEGQRETKTFYPGIGTSAFSDNLPYGGLIQQSLEISYVIGEEDETQPGIFGATIWLKTDPKSITTNVDPSGNFPNGSVDLSTGAISMDLAGLTVPTIKQYVTYGLASAGLSA